MNSYNELWIIPPQFDDGSSSWYAASTYMLEYPPWGGYPHYLITPAVDLRQSETFKLDFDSYFDGNSGQLARIEYSIDSCQTWQLLDNLLPVFNWAHVTVDLSELSGIENGNEQIWFSFNSDDEGEYRSGWAIDNVCISNGPAPIYGYYVYLNDEFIAQTTPEVRTFTFEDLEYSTEYTAMVRVLYSCGLSDPIYYTWNSTYLYPPRNLSDDYIYNTNDVPLIWNPPINANGDSVPDGVLSFNIYRNGDSLTNIVYDSLVSPDFEFVYVDTELNPGTYLYDISAIYDLTVFDSTLQTGESMFTETDTVEVIWGAELPFFEDWAQNSFEFQQWETDGVNWVINSSIGNDAPSAEFSWEPLIEEDYSVSLTSNFLRADSLSEGDIFLDFDLKLEDRNSTGEEMLQVEIKGTDGSWDVLDRFVNSGSFDLTPHHIAITNDAKGEVFRLRFSAVGQNSYDIVGWYIDNIHVYRDCNPPRDLTGEYVWNFEDDLGVELCWDAPELLPGPCLQWIAWDSGENAGAIGLTEEGPFSCAARWDAGMLDTYDGTYITKVRFFPSDDGFSTVTIKIWYGPDASILVAEKELLVNQITIGEHNTVTLDTPIEIDASQELWVGYTIVQVGTGVFPAGHDEGPAVAGYGDKVSLDGYTWDNLSDFGPDFDVNWNIGCYVVELKQIHKPTPCIIKQHAFGALSQPSSLRQKKRETPLTMKNTQDRDFWGFNLFRKQLGQDYELYAEVPYVEGQLYYCYWDAYPAVNLSELYSYQVTAVYEGEFDVCESSPAWAYYLSEDDFVEVFVTDIENHGVNSEIVNLFPNPVTDHLTITSLLPLNKIIVYDSRGHLIFNSDVPNSTSFNLNTSSYTNGIYIIKMKTEKTTIVKRFVVGR